jgi:glycosyltransferase involved in cell wall biosynthesis
VSGTFVTDYGTGEGTRLSVLWVVHYPVFGGPHNRILRLAPLLAEQGIDVVALLPSEPGNAVDRLRSAGVPVMTTSLSRVRALGRVRDQVRLLQAFRGDVRRVRGAIRVVSADVVVLGGLINSQAALAAHLEDTALVWQVLDSRTPRPVAATLMPVVDRLADTVTFAGPALIDSHPGASGLRVPKLVSTPGVDIEKFRPSPEARARVRSELGIPPEATVVGSLANVNPQKGIEYFVQAAGIISEVRPDTWFVVVGAESADHRDYRELIDAEIARAGIPTGRLIFAGEQTNTQEWFPAMDVKLMTSVPNSEGTPTSILEAWACEVPPVATDVGSVAQLVADGEDGFVVPPNDAKAIADQALTLLDDPALRARLAAAGRRKVEVQYSLKRVADVHAEAMRSALTHRRGRR